MAKSRKLGDLSIKRGRPEAGEEIKGGKTKFTLGTAATLKSATLRLARVKSSAQSK